MNTIKKIALVLVAAVMSVGVSQAKLISFGVKAGANFNKLHLNKNITKDFNAKNCTGWTAGVMAEINLPVVGLGVDASLMYSRMNNGSDVPDLVSVGEDGYEVQDVNLFGKNFFSIPINIKYKISLPVVSKYVKPYVFTGPEFSFRMDKKVEDALANLKSRTFQMAWNVGIGVELINHVQIGASYGFGCNKVVEKIHLDQKFDANLDNIKNNYWTVTAAYVF